jgi:hypothetical protein
MDAVLRRYVRDRAENRCEYCHLPTIDRKTGTIVQLFHPRQDDWDANFVLQGARIVGLTPVGDATVRLLQMNSDQRVAMRAELLAAGTM